MGFLFYFEKMSRLESQITGARLLVPDVQQKEEINFLIHTQGARNGFIEIFCKV